MTNPRCPKCGETRPEKFSRDKAKQSGYQTYCKRHAQGRLASKVNVEAAVKRAMKYIEEK